MEKCVEAKNKARQNIRVADHMLTMTYPMIQDPKILLSVLDNIYLALTNSMTAVLHYERSFKNIPVFTDNFNSKFSSFRAYIVPNYNIPLKTVRFIAEIKELIQEHKDATTAFSRKKTYVIADNDYTKMRTLGEKELKKYLEETKEITAEILKLVK